MTPTSKYLSVAPTPDEETELVHAADCIAPNSPCSISSLYQSTVKFENVFPLAQHSKFGGIGNLLSFYSDTIIVGLGPAQFIDGITSPNVN